MMSPEYTNMSPFSSEEKRPGIKGKRRPGIPGRFDPSQPLHMTTRRAAKGVNGESPSLNGSAVDDESRRGSFDDLRPTTSRSFGSRSSNGSKQMADASEALFTPSASMGAFRSFDEPEPENDPESVHQHISGPSSPNESSDLLPSRKRKRSSSLGLPKTPPPAPIPEAIYTQDEDAMDITQDAEGESASPVEPSQMSDRAPPSVFSSQSDEQPNGEVVTAAPSTDITPMPSNGGSPASSMSGASEMQTPAKVATDAEDSAMLEDEAEGFEEEEEVDQGEEAEDAEVDDPAQSADEDRPKRRMGGRKRVAHPIPRVETAMRRQADVKTAYRQITRSLKAILIELTQRTTDELEESNEKYREAQEYDVVKAGLDDALQRRKNRILRQSELDKKLIIDRCEAETAIRRDQLRLQIADLDDHHLHEVEKQLLSVARAIEMHGQGEYYTEDEDDIIPRLKQSAYRFRRGDALDPEYESRSRPAMETSGAADRLNIRNQVKKMIKELSLEDQPDDIGAFAVMNATPRTAVLLKREEINRTHMLADAAAEIERLQGLPVISNEEAVGLQVLSDMAARPPLLPMVPREMPPSHQHHMFGPPLPPVSLLPSPGLSGHRDGFQPAPLQLSRPPNEHYDTSMPPPSTPRQTPTTAAFSPGLSRLERPTPEPIHANGRPSLAPASPGYDSRSESESGAYPPGRPMEPAYKREPSQDNLDPRLAPPPWRAPPMEFDRRPDEFAPHDFRRSTESAVSLPPIQHRPNSRDMHRMQDSENAAYSRELLHGRSPSRERLSMFSGERQSLPPLPLPPTEYQYPDPGQTSGPWRPSAGPPHSGPQSATPMISLDNQELHTDGGLSESRRQRSKTYQGPFRKGGKDDRSSEPRRKHRKSSSKSTSNGATPTMAAAPIAKTPAEQGRRPSFNGKASPETLPKGPPLGWVPPSGHMFGRMDGHVLHMGQQPGPPSGPPGPPGPPPHQRAPYPYSHGPPYDGPPMPSHRHSLSGGGGHASPPGWPQNPLYAVPTGPSPPPGSRPDQYHPHPQFPLPPPMHMSPMNQPPPHPNTFGQGYRGPAIAPAPRNEDPRFRATGPAPLPAFAQQAEAENARRRALSEAQKQPKIHQWTPPVPKK